MTAKEKLIYVPPPIKKLPFYISLAGITYEDPGYYIERTNSSVIVVEYVISGKGHIERDGKKITVSAGDMYILPEGDTHAYYSDPVNPWRKIWFNASGPLFAQLCNTYNINGKLVFRSLDGYDLMKKMLDLCYNENLSATEINTRAALILMEIIMLMADHETEAISEDAEKLRTYLDLHITEKISLGDMAAHIFKSESQTLRIFKKAFNLTPYDYLTKTRITLAKTLLRGSSLSIRDIAFRVGFNDEHYFSTIFRDKAGVTPSDYRKTK